ncbi:4-vinyl reductase [Variovorax sp. UMC13]|uniref:4-vinyl reductase n=1 Tax=Variovorax sp. UMC13 TaxID=1862326 RepID=UPI001602A9E5|nr:4-vinyl reductase [Variovorax sp. UMC13]MBB1598477.1 hypothetical protein [Variovorax sp. UMC13]
MNDQRNPQVPIDVDPDSGVWRSDGLPMVYLPRHFFIDNHRLVRAAMGRAAHARLLYESGYESAWTWSSRVAAQGELDGIAVFRHYLARISQRGWGRFHIESLDEATGAARIRLAHSIFVEQAGRGSSESTLCDLFEGWFPGSLEWVGRGERRPWRLRCREIACAGQPGHAHCVFEVRPRTE